MSRVGGWVGGWRGGGRHLFRRRAGGRRLCAHGVLTTPLPNARMVLRSRPLRHATCPWCCRPRRGVHLPCQLQITRLLSQLSSALCAAGRGAVYTYDAIGSYERVGYGCQGSGKELIQPVLDNQLKAASPLVLPAQVCAGRARCVCDGGWRSWGAAPAAAPSLLGRQALHQHIRPAALATLTPPPPARAAMAELAAAGAGGGSGQGRVCVGGGARHLHSELGGRAMAVSWPSSTQRLVPLRPSAAPGRGRGGPKVHSWKGGRAASCAAQRRPHRELWTDCCPLCCAAGRRRGNPDPHQGWHPHRQAGAQARLSGSCAAATRQLGCGMPKR